MIYTHDDLYRRVVFHFGRRLSGVWAENSRVFVRWNQP